MFDIRKALDFNEKGRAVCPSCLASKGAKHRSKNLSVDMATGAYFCHAGCKSVEIRAAIGKENTTYNQPPTKERRVRGVSEETIISRKNHLLENAKLMTYLKMRGIEKELINRHLLGFRMVTIEKTSSPAITIPYRTESGAFREKLRINPLGESDPPWMQSGINAQIWITNNPKNPRATWFCEGEWDAIVLGDLVRKSGELIQVCCSSSGCSTVPPRDQLDRLSDRVIIWFDRNDKPTKTGKIPGDEGAIKLAQALGNRGYIAAVPMPEDASVHGWDCTDAIQSGYGIQSFLDAEQHAFQIEPKQKTKKNLASRLVTHSQLMARAPSYVEFLIEELLSYELYVLAAPPRGGKSLMVMTLAKAVACGEEFLGRPTTQGTVLIINLEDPDAKVRERAEAQGWADDLPIYWIDKFKLEELEDLTEILNKLDNLRLVIIDTLSRAKSSKISESSAEMSGLLEPLQELAKDRGICVFLTHHTGKINVEGAGEQVDVFDNIRGSSAIRATCRGAWLIAPGNNCYRLVCENGYGKYDLKILLDPRSVTWKLIGKWAPNVDGSIKEQILQYLTLTGTANVIQIAEGTNQKPKTVGTVLGRLQSEGLISKQGGVGRRPATYTRSSNLLQQLEQMLEQENSGGESDTGSLQQKEKISSFSNVQGNPSHDCSTAQQTPPPLPVGTSTQTPESLTVIDSHVPTLVPTVAPEDRTQTQAPKGVQRCSNNPDLAPTGEAFDCFIFLNKQWIKAIYSHPKSEGKMSKFLKKVEDSHAVNYWPENGVKTSIVLAESDIRRIPKR